MLLFNIDKKVKMWGAFVSGPSSISVYRARRNRMVNDETDSRLSADEVVPSAGAIVVGPSLGELWSSLFNKLGSPCSARSLELFHTRYHAVPKLEMLAPLAAAAKW